METKKKLYIHCYDHIEENDLIITSIINCNTPPQKYYVSPSPKNAAMMKTEIYVLREKMKMEIRALENEESSSDEKNSLNDKPRDLARNFSNYPFSDGKNYPKIYAKKLENKKATIEIYNRNLHQLSSGNLPIIFLCSSSVCKQISSGNVLLQLLFDKCRECRKAFCVKCCVKKSKGAWCHDCLIIIGFR